MIDNQLPPELALHLTTRGYLASHVADVGLDAADDRTIWAYAVSNACVVVSTDEDFFYLAVGDPSGPQLVWVRLGNGRTPILLAAFDRVLPALVAALTAGQHIVELR